MCTEEKDWEENLLERVLHQTVPESDSDEELDVHDSHDKLSAKAAAVYLHELRNLMIVLKC